MPTRSEMLAKLSPGEREKIEAQLKIEASTFTYPERLEEAIQYVKELIDEFTLEGGITCDENNTVVEQSTERAQRMARMLVQEWKGTPPTGEIVTTIAYFLQIMTFSCLGTGQLQGFMRVIEANLRLMNTQMLPLAVQEIIAEEPTTN